MKGSLYLHLFDSNRLFFLDLTNACFLDRQNTIPATKTLELILSGLREPINRSATQISELQYSFKREYENHLFCQIIHSSLLQAFLTLHHRSHGSWLPDILWWISRGYGNSQYTNSSYRIGAAGTFQMDVANPMQDPS